MKAALLIILVLLTGCAVLPPMSASEARATAELAGCWPYGVVQPLPTATSLRAGTPLPTALAPTATPFAGSWPECTPIPGTPTLAPSPTPWPTPRPPQTALPAGNLPVASGGLVEIGDQPGYVTNATVAIDPASGLAAVGWISWGATADEALDGNVWIRVQQSAQYWDYAQTLNIDPVNKGNGGLGMVFLPDATLVAAWSHGPASGDPQIVVMISADRGATWSEPLATPMHGTVLSLQSDQRGGLHLLYLEPAGAGTVVRYGARSTAGTWEVSEPLATGSAAALGLLAQPDGTVTRFIGVVDAPQGVLLLRNDGGGWSSQIVESGRFMPEESRQDASLVTALRPDGALVALAWSQYAQPGAFAVVSTDGGNTWSAEERIALRDTPRDGSGAPTGCCGSGYAPSLAYDRASDMLVAVWLQRDFDTLLWRTLLAARPLDGSTGDPWRYALTAEQDAGAVALSDSGWRGALAGTPDGSRHWLLLLDDRNGQQRLSARPIDLVGYLIAGDS